jgi:phosphate transport system substrate-binding protein
MALAEGTAQLGMSSRPVKTKEVEQLSKLGDMLSRACEHVVGLDGLAVIVNHSNPISALDVAQVAGIFSGEITDWSQLGGPSGAITIYARDDKSGTFDSFSSMVLLEKKLRADAKRFEDSNALSDHVAADPNGIGFIGLPYVRNSKALTLSDTGTQPKFPSPFTVATEDYVLSRRLFLYSPAVPNHPWTLNFVEFVLAAEGQEIVEQVGFISQTIEVEQVSVSADMPQKFREFLSTSASQRLSTAFRFRSKEAELDSKATRDLDRVVRFLARPENRSKRVYLLGFADSLGSRAVNLKLSEDRVKSVTRELSVRGVTPTAAIGMGSVMPVASNESVDGQRKNRRVEVWIQ